MRSDVGRKSYVRLEWSVWKLNSWRALENIHGSELWVPAGTTTNPHVLYDCAIPSGAPDAYESARRVVSSARCASQPGDVPHDTTERGLTECTSSSSSRL